MFSVASVSRGNYFLSRSGANSIHRSWLFIQDQSWRSRIFPAFHWIETHRISSQCKYLWVTPLYASEISLSWYPWRQQKYFFLERLWAILKFRAFDISLSCALVDFSWSFIVGQKTTVGTWKKRFREGSRSVQINSVSFSALSDRNWMKKKISDCISDLIIEEYPWKHE